MKRACCIVVVLFVAGCNLSEELDTSVGEAALDDAVVDPRLELYQVPTKLGHRAAGADVYSIPLSSVAPRPDGDYDLLSTPFTNIGNGPTGTPLCPDASFYAQPRLFAGATGVLVGEDLVLTVWHAMHSQLDCDNRALILDHAIAEPPDADEPPVLPAEDVFFCKELVATGGGPPGSTGDWSLIRLTNPVDADHVPIKLRRGGAITPGSPALLVGHPHRLLAKIESTTVSGSGTSVNGPGNIWVGSSGSMIANAGTGRVEGIVYSGGIPAPIYDPVGQCYRECTAPSCNGSYLALGSSAFAPSVPLVGMEVTPVATVDHHGPPGGPFTNPSTTYTLAVSAEGRAVTPYVTPKDALLVEGPSIGSDGAIPPGGSRAVPVLLVAAAAATLPVGVHDTGVTFLDVPYISRDARAHRVLVGVDGFTATATASASPVVLRYGLANQYLVAQDVTAETDAAWIGLNEGGQAVTLTLPPVDSADRRPQLRVGRDPAVEDPPPGTEATLVFQSGGSFAPWHTVVRHVQWDGARIVPID